MVLEFSCVPSTNTVTVVPTNDTATWCHAPLLMFDVPNTKVAPPPLRDMP